jgi:hypothetical protein
MPRICPVCSGPTDDGRHSRKVFDTGQYCIPVFVCPEVPKGEMRILDVRAAPG